MINGTDNKLYMLHNPLLTTEISKKEGRKVAKERGAKCRECFLLHREREENVRKKKKKKKRKN